MMKFLSLILLVFISSITAAQSVSVTFGYDTDAQYLRVNETSVDITMNFSGDQSNLPNSLQSQYPMDIKMQDVLEQKIFTGKENTDGSYPITVKTDSKESYFSMNGDEMDSLSPWRDLQNVSVKGLIKPDSSIEYLSMENTDAGTEVETIMQAMLEQMAQSNVIAGHTLSIGDTASVIVPFNAPAGNLGAVTFDMEVNYTLISINPWCIMKAPP